MVPSRTHGGAIRVGPASECVKMADQLLARVEQLSSAFARLEARASWVRAGFTLKAGRFGFFGLGPSDGDGPDSAIIRGLSFQELQIVTELYALTEGAGTLVLEAIRSGRYAGKPVVGKSIHYEVERPWHPWLLFLLHFPPMLFHCQTKG